MIISERRCTPSMVIDNSVTTVITTKEKEEEKKAFQRKVAGSIIVSSVFLGGVYCATSDEYVKLKLSAIEKSVEKVMNLCGDDPGLSYGINFYRSFVAWFNPYKQRVKTLALTKAEIILSALTVGGGIFVNNAILGWAGIGGAVLGASYLIWKNCHPFRNEQLETEKSRYLQLLFELDHVENQLILRNEPMMQPGSYSFEASAPSF